MANRTNPRLLKRGGGQGNENPGGESPEAGQMEILAKRRNGAGAHLGGSREDVRWEDVTGTPIR